MNEKGPLLGCTRAGASGEDDRGAPAFGPGCTLPGSTAWSRPHTGRHLSTQEARRGPPHTGGTHRQGPRWCSPR